ncbi:MAG TPA: preprotein translocase subunit SecE [Candidatus Obscuribacterales bacterium]
MATRKKGREAGKESKASEDQPASNPDTGKSNGNPRQPAAGAGQKDARKESGKSSAQAKAKNDQAAKAAAKAKKKDEESEIGESIKDVRQFLKEVVIEFRKITWPSRRQVIQETWSVLFLVTLITLMVFGFDKVLAMVVFGPLEHWARLHGGGVGRM